MFVGPSQSRSLTCATNDAGVASVTLDVVTRPVPKPAPIASSMIVGDVAIGLRRGRDSARARQNAARHRGRTIRRVGDVDGHRGIILAQRLHLHGAAYGHVVEPQSAVEADEVVARDRDLVVVHAVADDQDHFRRGAAGPGRDLRGASAQRGARGGRNRREPARRGRARLNQRSRTTLFDLTTMSLRMRLPRFGATVYLKLRRRVLGAIKSSRAELWETMGPRAAFCG